MGFVARRAADESRALAVLRGAFPNFGQSAYARRQAAPIRNATRTAIAPTGTLSLIAGCSSGIEPYYALGYRRRALDGVEFRLVNERFEASAVEAGLDRHAIDEVLERGRVRGDLTVPPHLRHLFPVAADVPVDAQIRMQAAFQAHVDNAVSKTLLLGEEATALTVRQAFESAFAKGCKGLTVYREGSRLDQVLTSGIVPGACPSCGADRECIEAATLCRTCGFSEPT
jgi:ribonucleoside-diphosphate reductase alpha chain